MFDYKIVAGVTVLLLAVTTSYGRGRETPSLSNLARNAYEEGRKKLSNTPVAEDAEGFVSWMKGKFNSQLNSAINENKRLNEFYGNMKNNSNISMTLSLKELVKKLKKPTRYPNTYLPYMRLISSHKAFSSSNFSVMLFKKTDANGDGIVTMEEAKNMTQDFGLPQNYVEDLFKEVDTNKDGKINRTEAEKYTFFLVTKKKITEVPKSLKEMWNMLGYKKKRFNLRQFDKADIDNNRIATKEEMENIIGKEETKNLFDMLDKDKDGNLTIKEAIAGITQTRGPISFSKMLDKLKGNKELSKIEDHLKERVDGVLKKFLGKLGKSSSPKRGNVDLLQRKVKKLIKTADTDGDDQLSKEEAETALRNSSTETAEKKCNEMFEQYDKNKDGNIEKNEVESTSLSVLSKLKLDVNFNIQSIPLVNRIQNKWKGSVFQRADADRDEAVTKKELMEELEKQTNREISRNLQKIFLTYDSNKDGKIDKKESNVRKGKKKTRKPSFLLRWTAEKLLNNAASNGDDKVSKEEASNYFLKKTSQKVIEKVEGSFQKYDRNNDGKITKEEYDRRVKNSFFSMLMASWKDGIGSADSNRDDAVTLEEMTKSFKAKYNKKDAEKVKEIFSAFDNNKDGFIDKEEVKEEEGQREEQGFFQQVLGLFKEG